MGPTNWGPNASQVNATPIRRSRIPAPIGMYSTRMAAPELSVGSDRQTVKARFGSSFDDFSVLDGYESAKRGRTAISLEDAQHTSDNPGHNDSCGTSQWTGGTRRRRPGHRGRYGDEIECPEGPHPAKRPPAGWFCGCGS